MSLTGALTGRIAVVTGAAQGIGRAVALEAARRGMRVAAVDLNPADETVGAIRDAGGEALGFTCDVGDGEAVLALAGDVRAAFGAVDVLVANAGTAVPGTVESQTVEDFTAVLRVNLFGTFHCVRAFTPLLREAASAGDGAAIVVTGSEHSLGVPANQQIASYTVSKHALLGLADVARHDLAESGVSVTLLCPGWTLTPGVVGFLDAHPEAAEPVRAVAQTPEDVATRAWDAAVAGTFLCITNPSSRPWVQARIEEIGSALERL